MKKHFRLLLLLAVLITAAVVSFTIIWRSKTPTVTVTPPPAIKTPVTGGVIGLNTRASLTRTENANDITIYLKPANASQEVSTLAMQIVIKASSGTLSTRSSNPTLGNIFKSFGWTPAFSTLVTNPDGTVNLNLTALNASPEPFTLDQEVELATISLTASDPDATFTYTISDPEVSKAYDKSGNLINYSFTNQPLTIAE
jgi:hypothetical protein